MKNNAVELNPQRLQLWGGFNYHILHSVKVMHLHSFINFYY